MSRLRDALPASLLELRRVDHEFWRRFAYYGAAEMPEWWRRYSPSVFGALFAALLRDKRALVASHQATLRGLAPGSLAAQRAAVETFAQYAECLTDGLELAGRPERPFEVVGEHPEALDEALANGSGAVLLTAHTGSWEVAGQGLLAHRERKVTMVMAEEPDAAARRYADELRTRWGVEIVHAGGKDPSTALTLVSRLRAGGVVAVQCDRVPKALGTLAVRVCGRLFAMPEGPFRLAQASGAPLVTAFTRRAGYRRYAVHLGGPFRVPRRASPEELLAVAQRAADKLGAFLAAWPAQWFHFGPWPEPSQGAPEATPRDRGLLA